MLPFLYIAFGYRCVTNASGTVTQKNHYYPFGTTFAESTSADAQPYKYNGKELDKMHGLNLYDYSARYYESLIGRFTTIDPLAEKYYSISPYAYVGNNPLKYTDPTGMVIDSAHIAQWNRERRLILAELGTLLANNPDGMNNGRISSLQNTLINMRLAENSTQLYQLGNASGNIGELVYNPNTKAVIINYSGTASFVHEVTHVSQFEKGDIGFLSEGGVIANDINDEISAYKAQYNFDSNSVSSLSSTSTLNNINDINSSWVQGLNGGGFYTPGGTANTGVSILNKNSTKIDFVRSLGINGIFRYQELIMGIPIRNYPNAVFKIK